MTRRPSPQAIRLLSALVEKAQAWRHGYDLSKETGLTPGTLYPLLARLETQGLLESEWREPELDGRPRRHAYRLTRAGAAFALQWTAGADLEADPGLAIRSAQ
jgi:PadR family transcriptional regulator, regulatory protein PadR